MSEMFNAVMIALSLEASPLTSAQAFIAAAKLHPEATMQISVAGFDDDPRELWEMPKVMALLRRFLAHVRQLGGEGLNRLDSISEALLLYASGLAKAKKQPDGSTTFECTQRLV